MAERRSSLVVRLPTAGGASGVDLNEVVARAVASNPSLRELVVRFDVASKARAKPSPLLTRREVEILTYVAQGFTNEQIARCLWVTPETVKFHLRNAFRKLGTHKRHEAARAAWRQHLLPSGQVSDGSDHRRA